MFIFNEMLFPFSDRKKSSDKMPFSNAQIDDFWNSLFFTHSRRTKVCKKLRRHYAQMAQLGELRVLWLDGRGFESHPRPNIFALFIESNYTWNQII